jgi:hypothetical protein
VHLRQQAIQRPRARPCRHLAVVASQAPIIREPRFMAQQLTSGEGLACQRSSSSSLPCSTRRRVAIDSTILVKLHQGTRVDDPANVTVPSRPTMAVAF